MLKIVWQRGFSRIIGVFVILSISDVLVGKASDDTENINEWQANSETTVEYILNANNSSYEFESNATTTSDRTSTEEEDQLWRTNLKPKIRIQPAQYVSPNIHSEVGSNDELSDYIEDYGDTAIESKRPAIVDDEAIENLLERLLNPILSEKPQFNEKIALLINSSTYWNDENIQPPMSIKDPQEAKKWIDGYSEEAQKILHEVALAHWEYLTSRTTFNERSMQEADDALSLFVRAVTKQVKQYDLVSLNDTMLRGQFEMLSYEGINALDDSLLTKYLNVSMKPYFALTLNKFDLLDKLFKLPSDFQTLFDSYHQRVLNIYGILFMKRLERDQALNSVDNIRAFILGCSKYLRHTEAHSPYLRRTVIFKKYGLETP